MIKNIFLYLKAFSTDFFGVVFFLLNILSLISLFVPTPSRVTETYFPKGSYIGILVLALLFLVANVRIYLKLTAQVSNLTKKLKPKIETTIENVSGYDEIYANQPLTRWAMKIKITNKSDDSIFFSGGEAILFFRKSAFSFFNFFLRIFSKGMTLDYLLQFSIPIYNNGLSISTNAFKHESFFDGIWNWSDNDSSPLLRIKNIFVCNWETKQPIIFSSTQEYRGPDPKSVQLWTIYGKFPQELGRKLHSAGYILSHIALRFRTDQGTFIAYNSQIPLKSIDDVFGKHLTKIETNARNNFPEIFNNMSLRPLTMETPSSKISQHSTADLATARALPADYQTWKKPNNLEGKSTKHFEKEE